jgi:hypothetical protein
VAVAGRLLTAVGAVLLNVLLTKMGVDWFAAREIVWAMSIAINAWPVGIGLALFVLPAIASTWGLAAVVHVAAVAAALAWLAVAASVERAGALLGFNTPLFIASVQAGSAAAQWLARAEIDRVGSANRFQPGRRRHPSDKGDVTP